MIDLEYSSIKSKVNQILKIFPNDILKYSLSPTKIMGLLLIYVKKRLTKVTETIEVKSFENLQKATNDIKKEINKINSTSIFVSKVNNYFVLNAIQDLCNEGKILKEMKILSITQKLEMLKLIIQVQ